MNFRDKTCPNLVDQMDFPFDHRPMEQEYRFYQAVQAGDLNYVRQSCSEMTFGDPNGMGILSNIPLTNIKYHFVIATAMIARYCVKGGMPFEHSYRLSDYYILQLDTCNQVEEVLELHKKMVIDYTTNMNTLQNGSVLSKPITQCIDFIYSHIQERITINDLSDYTKLSSSYLSKLFKKELGISISDYIRKKKIETAQNLLRYSQYSLVEISNYLAFSSQSHFIQTFEKQVGTTPKKYRDHYYRTSW